MDDDDDVDVDDELATKRVCSDSWPRRGYPLGKYWLRHTILSRSRDLKPSSTGARRRARGDRGYTVSHKVYARNHSSQLFQSARHTFERVSSLQASSISSPSHLPSPSPTTRKFRRIGQSLPPPPIHRDSREIRSINGGRTTILREQLMPATAPHCRD